MEIIGTGYGKSIEIGESYLQEEVVNMWSFVDKDVFSYNSRGYLFTLREVTKVAENRYQHRALLKSEITDEIIKCLIKK